MRRSYIAEVEKQLADVKDFYKSREKNNRYDCSEQRLDRIMQHVKPLESFIDREGRASAYSIVSQVGLTFPLEYCCSPFAASMRLFAAITAVDEILAGAYPQYSYSYKKFDSRSKKEN